MPLSFYRPEITLVTGPMFSGKTTTFLFLRKMVPDGESKTPIFYPEVYSSECALETHTHAKVENAITLQFPEDLLDYLHLEYFFIDEAALWPDPESLVKVVAALWKRGKYINLASFSTDANGNEPRIIQSLKGLATVRIERSSVCTLCKRSAQFSEKIKGDFTKIIEPNAIFEPRCGRCFTPAWRKDETINSRIIARSNGDRNSGSK